MCKVEIKIEIKDKELSKVLEKELPCQIELNRAWIYDNKHETIGETNFVVSEEFIKKVFEETYSADYDDVEEFLDIYVPEEDGDYIYQRALKENEIIEDIGEVLY